MGGGNLKVGAIALCALGAMATGVAAQSTHHGQHTAAPPKQTATPYAGQQDRTIKSLSQSDIAQLRAGGGWGFAKPAELSGYPGPRHVLDLGQKLKLTPVQREKIEAIFEAMNKDARAVGADFIAAEQALSEAFTSGAITDKDLADLLAEAGRQRARLRRVHLAAHLKTKPLLTRHQRMMYDRLRGYADGNTHDHRH